MNKIFLVLLIAFSNSLFAFDGIVKQQYVNPENNEVQMFTWYISGENIKLDIQKEDGSSYTIIPDIKNRAINVLMNNAGDDGKYWYFNVPLSKANALEDVVFVEKQNSTFEKYETVDVKLLTERGLMTLQYSPQIEFNTVLLGNYFTENEEFGALKQMNIASGFPLNSLVISKENNQGVYALKTLSISEETVNVSTFNIPSNYNLYEAVSVTE